ncbi:hypothetical protein B0H34DRAFT_802736 [Crassisporium funariophilum]|nr:hypothetical protein B0H34DRAFT_802736 [Crassisporium funariophilum]
MEIEWEGLKGGEHCLRYATREYTAKLPIGLTGPEAMKACKDTPVKIHGRLLYTDFCRDLALGRGVWGFWVVDFEEPACVTSWGEFVDLGCGYQAVDTISSFKRVESRLENLQIGADWQIMCVTTPADIVGRHFATPTTCQNSGKLGVYGTWDVNDESCDEGSEDK